jgi:hypothetical protein
VVRLFGPPIARACAPRPSDDWIRVSETAEGLDISVDTANAGTLRGTLDLKGPTDQVVIAIDAELIPQQARQGTTEAPPPSGEEARREAADAAQREAEERARQEAAESAQRQAEERARQKAAETAAQREAEEKTRQETAEAAQQQAGEQARRNAAEAAEREAREQARQEMPEAPSAALAPIQRGAAFAGSGVALLASITGLISLALSYTPPLQASYFFAIVAYLAVAGAAVAVLLRVDQLTAIGFLQGLCWPSAAYLVADILNLTVNHAFGLTGRYLGGLRVNLISDLLLLSAAILLMVSWHPAVGGLRATRLRPLAVALLVGVGLSQVAGLVLWTHGSQYGSSYVLGIAALLVGLAVTWYAVSLRAHALGGALVLGWAITSALVSLGFNKWSAPGLLALALVLLAAVVVLAVRYIRQPSDPAPGHSEP